MSARTLPAGGANRPAQLRRLCAAVGECLLLRRADDVTCSRRIDAAASAIAEGGLDPSVFPRMKREHDDATTGRETARERLQQRIERRQLVVHRNAQRLKR